MDLKFASLSKVGLMHDTETSGQDGSGGTIALVVGPVKLRAAVFEPAMWIKQVRHHVVSTPPGSVAAASACKLTKAESLAEQ